MQCHVSNNSIKCVISAQKDKTTDGGLGDLLRAKSLKLWYDSTFKLRKTKQTRLKRETERSIGNNWDYSEISTVRTWKERDSPKWKTRSGQGYAWKVTVHLEEESRVTPCHQPICVSLHPNRASVQTPLWVKLSYMHKISDWEPALSASRVIMHSVWLPLAAICCPSWLLSALVGTLCEISRWIWIIQLK